MYTPYFYNISHYNILNAMDENNPPANVPTTSNVAAARQVDEDTTSPINVLLNELMGKKVLVKTNGGSGIRDQLLEEGTYPGILIGSDQHFIKLEYSVQRFINGNPVDSKETILVNIAYIITVEEYRTREF